MEQKINLEKLEKRTAAGIFQTGIIEIGIGMIFIVSSLAMIFDNIRFYIDILYVVPVVFIILSVRYIAQPRMGMVKLSKRRVRNNKRLITALTIFLIVMVTLTVFGNTSTISEFISPKWIVIGIIFFVCIAIAYFMRFDRMYLYAYLLSGTFYLSEEIREIPGIISDGGYAYLFASIVLISIGFVYLVKFLKKYPLPEKDVSYD